MPTLAEIITRKWQEAHAKPAESLICNPCNAAITGKHPSVFTINTPELSSLRFSVKGIRETKRSGYDSFADYDLVARTIDEPPQTVERRLRLVPLPDPEDGKTHSNVLLHLYDEFGFNQDFLDKLNTPPEWTCDVEANGQKDTLPIRANDINEARQLITEQYPNCKVVKVERTDIPDLHDSNDGSDWWRVNDIQSAWEGETAYVSDLDHNGKIDPKETQSGTIAYWDFYRQIEIDGNQVIEFLFVEMDENHFFQIWRGVMVDPGRVEKVV